VFLQVFGGYGDAYQANDRAYMCVPVFEANQLIADLDSPYDNKGALDKERTNVPNAVSEDCFKLYSHKRRGYAWSADVSLGAIFSWKNCYFLDTIAIEPRIGFTYESLKISKSFHAQLDGGYVALSIPFSFYKIYFNTDVSYVFAGQRSSRIGLWNAIDNDSSFISTNKGTVTGFKVNVGAEYEVYCNLFVGFTWRYFHLKTSGGKFKLLIDSVFWRPENHWTSNQFLGTVSYNF
jgi:hypothetical protein